MAERGLSIDREDDIVVRVWRGKDLTFYSDLHLLDEGFTGPSQGHFIVVPLESVLKYTYSSAH